MTTEQRSGAVIYEPGVYVFDVVFPQGVSFIVEEPGFDARDMRSQPLTVAEWYGPVLAAVQQQHRDRYLGHVETPRGQLRHAVERGAQRLPARGAAASGERGRAHLLVA